VNLFVAGFIGTPPMNFFEGRIRNGGNAMRFEGDDGFSLPVPADKRNAVAAYVDKPVTAGIRPEHIGSAAAEQPPQAPRIRANVDVVEPMGAEIYVHLTTGDKSFVMRTESAKTYPVGQPCEPAVLVERVHYFDPQTGETLA
jgi:multiple sugar transport system ATP-binding protein